MKTGHDHLIVQLFVGIPVSVALLLATLDWLSRLLR
jgi:hypothetical protein